ncbi:phosphatidylinositol 3-kinase [Pycnococcus provasolii]
MLIDDASALASSLLGAPPQGLALLCHDLSLLIAAAMPNLMPAEAHVNIALAMQRAVAYAHADSEANKTNQTTREQAAQILDTATATMQAMAAQLAKPAALASAQHKELTTILKLTAAASACAATCARAVLTNAAELSKRNRQAYASYVQHALHLAHLLTVACDEPKFAHAREAAMQVVALLLQHLEETPLREHSFSTHELNRLQFVGLFCHRLDAAKDMLRPPTTTTTVSPSAAATSLLATVFSLRSVHTNSSLDLLHERAATLHVFSSSLLGSLTANQRHFDALVSTYPWGVPEILAAAAEKLVKTTKPAEIATTTNMIVEAMDNLSDALELDVTNIPVNRVANHVVARIIEAISRLGACAIGLMAKSLGTTKFHEELAESFGRAFDTVCQLFSALGTQSAHMGETLARVFSDSLHHLVQSVMTCIANDKSNSNLGVNAASFAPIARAMRARVLALANEITLFALMRETHSHEDAVDKLLPCVTVACEVCVACEAQEGSTRTSDQDRLVVATTSHWKYSEPTTSSSIARLLRTWWFHLTVANFKDGEPPKEYRRLAVTMPALTSLAQEQLYEAEIEFEALLNQAHPPVTPKQSSIIAAITSHLPDERRGGHTAVLSSMATGRLCTLLLCATVESLRVHGWHEHTLRQRDDLVNMESVSATLFRAFEYIENPSLHSRMMVSTRDVEFEGESVSPEFVFFTSLAREVFRRHIDELSQQLASSDEAIRNFAESSIMQLARGLLTRMQIVEGNAVSRRIAADIVRHLLERFPSLHFASRVFYRLFQVEARNHFVECTKSAGHIALMDDADDVGMQRKKGSDANGNGMHGVRNSWYKAALSTAEAPTRALLIQMFLYPTSMFHHHDKADALDVDFPEVPQSTLLELLTAPRSGNADDSLAAFSDHAVAVGFVRASAPQDAGMAQVEKLADSFIVDDGVIRAASHEQFKDIAVRAGALALRAIELHASSSTSSSQIPTVAHRLIKFLVELPLLRLNPPSMKTCIDVWNWVATVSPDVRHQVVAGAASSFASSAVMRIGMFATSAYGSQRLRPLLLPSRGNEETDREDAVAREAAGHTLWIHFMHDHWLMTQCDAIGRHIFMHIFTSMLDATVRANLTTRHPSGEEPSYALAELALLHATRMREVGSNGSAGRAYDALTYAVSLFDEAPQWRWTGGRRTEAKMNALAKLLSAASDANATFSDQRRVVKIHRLLDVLGGSEGERLLALLYPTKIPQGAVPGPLRAKALLPAASGSTKSKASSEAGVATPIVGSSRSLTRDRSLSFSESSSTVAASSAARGWEELVETAWSISAKLAVAMLSRMPETESLTLLIAKKVGRAAQGDDLVGEVKRVPEAAALLLKAAETGIVPANALSALNDKPSWSVVPVATALAFLGGPLGENENVKRFSLRSLEAAPVSLVLTFLPQLIQLLQFDGNDGAIESFLKRAARDDELFAHRLIWSLRGEEAPPSDLSLLPKRSGWKEPSPTPLWPIVERLQKELLDDVLAAKTSAWFRRESDYFDAITSVSGKLYPIERDERRRAAQEMLAGIVADGDDLYLPVEPKWRLRKLLPQSGAVMQSAAKIPILVSFDVGDEREESDVAEDEAGRRDRASLIFKVGDDCRQDVLALQVITLLREVHHAAGLPSRLFSYRVLATGFERGIIEVVPNASSRASLGETSDGGLVEIFEREYGLPGSHSFETARENFIRSCAAYAVASMLLNSKDRHNGNILILREGHIVHIDFGFILEISPGGNLGFESAGFKLSHEMCRLIDPDGKRKSSSYMHFCDLAVRCYLVARQAREGIVTCIGLQQNSGLPCFGRGDPVTHINERFHAEMSDRQAADFMKATINDAYDKWTTGFYDAIQLLQNSIPV